MENSTYVIKITTIDNLYANYMVEAENLFFAKIKAREAFFRDYPDSDNNIKLSLENPDKVKIKEIVNIIKEAK